MEINRHLITEASNTIIFLNELIHGAVNGRSEESMKLAFTNAKDWWMKLSTQYEPEQREAVRENSDLKIKESAYVSRIRELAEQLRKAESQRDQYKEDLKTALIKS